MYFELTPVDSSLLSSVGYDAKNWTLYARFKKTGRLYRYSNVDPKLYEEMMQAESIGSFFSKEIKAKPFDYPYKEIEE